MSKHKKDKTQKKEKAQHFEVVTATPAHSGHNGHNGHNGFYEHYSQRAQARQAVVAPVQAGDELFQRLNRALALEYAAVIQYLHQHCSLRGPERQQFAPFFAANSTEAHLHAQNLGNKIVALGGVPTIEPAPVHPGETLGEMLLADLEVEREALDAYIKAWEAAQGNPPLVFWLEEIISEEQLHVDEMEKLCALHS